LQTHAAGPGGSPTWRLAGMGAAQG